MRGSRNYGEALSKAYTLGFLSKSTGNIYNSSEAAVRSKNLYRHIAVIHTWYTVS